MTEQIALQSTLDSTWPLLFSPFHTPSPSLFFLSYFSIVTIGLLMYKLWIGESHELAYVDSNGPRLVWWVLWFAADDNDNTDTNASTLYLWICTCSCA